ncbi:MAG: MobF family relaxase [Chitinophagaceae bacterium]
MIRMIQSSSAQHAKRYFSDALSKSDYYINDQELQGEFGGKLMARLGLGKAVNKDAFFNLAENKHPLKGDRLTPYTKGNRTTGYDINFHCPKSVSLLHVFSEDERVLKAFQDSVQDTMKDIEKDAKTRVRAKGKNEDRATGELLWSSFVHQTARAVADQVPDPHLHCHCFVFNTTWDESEKKIKAAQFRDIKQNMPNYQASFHKRLADKLVELGYAVKPTKNSFEIESISSELVTHFSKRSNEIGKIAHENGITDPAELDALGAKTRAKKQKGQSMSQLKEKWRQQIVKMGFQVNSKLFGEKAQNRVRQNDISCDAIIDRTLLHCFERASVVSERALYSQACRFALGFPDVKLDDLKQGLATDKRIIRLPQKAYTLCTTQEVLAEEREMVDLAKSGIGKCKPMYRETGLENGNQQERAIHEVLTTNNRISIIRGAAGSGKTTLMRLAIAKIEAIGKKVTVVAPTAAASRGVLKDEGYSNAQTVARLLADAEMQDDLKNQVLWVDESGLLGTKDMLALIKLTTNKNARLVLGGDTRQHSAVVRGDALRVVNVIGNIPTAEVNVIRRQRNEKYKSVVEDLAKGEVATAFDKLDGMGAIKVIDPNNPYKDLIKQYRKAIREKKSALVISPTHAQGDTVTREIREALKVDRKLGKKEIIATRLINQNLTQAEKSMIDSYHKGQAVQFNQHVDKIKRGSLWMVDEIKNGEVHLTNKRNKKEILPLKKSDRFDLFEIGEIALAKGDKVKVTRNCYEPNSSNKTEGSNDIKAKRMDNGLSLEVISFNKSGRIKLRNPISKTEYFIDKNFGHVAHEYCITSHSAQGKTTDEVLLIQPSSTFGATNAKQFYVSVSRGKHDVTIFTDDKDALLEHAKELGDRKSAIELVTNAEVNTNFVFDLKRREKKLDNEKIKTAKEYSRHQWMNAYEPTL